MNITLDIVRLLPNAARGRGPGPGDRGLRQVQAQAALREGVQGGQPHRPVSTVQYSTVQYSTVQGGQPHRPVSGEFRNFCNANTNPPPPKQKETRIAYDY